MNFTLCYIPVKSLGGVKIEELKKYISDESFYAQIFEFFEVFDHSGVCGKSKYKFYSDVYKKFNNSDWKDCLLQRLSEQKFQHYSTTIFANDQLFAVVFAYANNLTDKQIRQIANKNNFKKAWCILNYFLCNRDIEKYDRNSKNETFNYTVIIDSQEYQAKIKNNTLKLCKNNMLFEIK